MPPIHRIPQKEGFLCNRDKIIKDFIKKCIVCGGDLSLINIIRNLKKFTYEDVAFKIAYNHIFQFICCKCYYKNIKEEI